MKLSPFELERRRARVARLNEKRPPITVTLRHAPQPAAEDRLVELLLELLDPAGQSGER